MVRDSLGLGVFDRSSGRRSQLKAFVYDRCPVFRDALGDLMRAMPQFSAVACTSDSARVLEACRTGEADFALVDLDAGQESIALLKSIKDITDRKVMCVMMISDGGKSELMAAIRMQADGFLTKRLEAGEFVEQLARVAEGEMVISDMLTTALADTLRNVPVQDDSRDLSSLSPRESEVLNCIASGMSNRSIAEKLQISDGTVKVHVKHVLKKLNFTTRVEAALWATKQQE